MGERGRKRVRQGDILCGVEDEEVNKKKKTIRKKEERRRTRKKLVKKNHTICTINLSPDLYIVVSMKTIN